VRTVGRKILRMSNRMTLLELVMRIAAHVDGDEEIVTVAAALVNSGAVELSGTFRGARIDLSRTRA
jgi:hypothetical protein